MCSWKYNNSTENCFTLPWWFPMVKPTSLPWNPCLVSPVHVLSCHIIPSNTSMMICPGGSPNSLTPNFTEAFPNRSILSMPMPTAMPAQVLASQLLSMGFGALGPYSQTGAPLTALRTSGGPRQLDLNCSSTSSFNSGSLPRASTSGFTVTTWESSMAGKMGEVGTGP